MALVHEDERVRIEQKHKNMAREIRRAFRRVAAALPEYDLFDVGGRGTADAGSKSNGADERTGASDRARASAAAGLARGADLAPGTEDESALVPDAADEMPQRETESEPALFPPGPLQRIRVTPSKLRVAPGAVRTLHARALDLDGRDVEGAVEWTWSLDGPGGLASDGAEARYAAPGEPGSARINVRAWAGAHAAATQVNVEILAELAAQERVSGIPEPEAVSAPGETWRSRFVGNRWQFNSAHRDYRLVETSDARRLRYLLHLFVKEVALRNFGQPSDAPLLERMVELLTHLESDRGSAAAVKDDTSSG
jgi:hypothetical protein